MFAAVELRFYLPAWPAGAVALGTSTLNHKSWDYSMKIQVVVEAGVRELEKVRDVVRSHVIPELNGHVA